MVRWMRSSVMVLALLLAMPIGASAGRTREEMRALFGAVPSAKIPSVYTAVPSAAPPYDPGALSHDALADALAYARCCRALAGLDGELRLSDELNGITQRGALLMAVLGSLSHTPSQPEGFPDALYQVGSEAAGASDLAMFNWMDGGLLRTAIDQFLLDDEGDNLATVGHRRWLLSPAMGYTGFGLANDPAGRSYAAMYVFDQSLSGDYDMICWPCGGAFPAELMSADMPWSISPNPQKYDLNASAPSIMLEDLSTGQTWSFNNPSGDPKTGAFFRIDEGRYGAGPAYLFRPECAGYTQNMRFRVTLEGMVSADGGQTGPITYMVEVASLTPIDPSDVELSAPTQSLAAGKCMTLSASVVPNWADDLTVTYESSDRAIAEVDASGTILARSPGEVTITARAVNGRSDALTITVTAN